MSTTARVSLSTPHEFLSYVPALVGVRPRDSIVFVAFRDTSTCGAMRLDLEPFTRPETLEAAIEAALDAVTRIPRLSGVLPVVYTARRFDDDCRIPHESIAAFLAPQIENRGIELVDFLCVAADAWGGYLDDSCRGNDLGLLTDPDDLPEGRVLNASDELRLPDVDASARESFAHANAVLDSAQEAAESEEQLIGGSTTGSEGRLFRVDDEFSSAMASYVDDGAEVLDAELALLAHLIAAPALRDVIAYSWAWGAEAGAHLWHRVFTPEEFTTESDDDPWMYAFAGRIEVRPDAERLRAAIGVLKRLCALQQPEERAPALTLISWCYWALGLSSFAAAWQRDAVEADGTYGLAIIMRMLLDAGTIPDWAFYDPNELVPDAGDATAPRATGSTR